MRYEYRTYLLLPAVLQESISYNETNYRRACNSVDCWDR